MRRLAIAVSAAALLALTACGTSSSSDTPAGVGSPRIPDRQAGMSGMDMSTPTATPTGSATSDSGALPSVQKDAADYAIRLEQVFSGSTYPKDLVGAVTAAEKLDLSLAPGNTIASYVYDPSDVEFKLCVENTSGAYAVYDTRPMTLQKSGPSGGCPN